MSHAWTQPLLEHAVMRLQASVRSEYGLGRRGCWNLPTVVYGARVCACRAGNKHGVVCEYKGIKGQVPLVLGRKCIPRLMPSWCRSPCELWWLIHWRTCLLHSDPAPVLREQGLIGEHCQWQSECLLYVELKHFAVSKGLETLRTYLVKNIVTTRKPLLIWFNFRLWASCLWRVPPPPPPSSMNGCT